MQSSMFDGPMSASRHVPTIVCKLVNDDYIAVRFRQIGNPQQFNTILGRFRFDFPLATCQQFADQPWWILAATQLNETEAFAKRNGLRWLKEE